MFQVAGIFILAEGIMYYLILNVWMNAWDFIGLDAIVTPAVWILAVWAWIYFIRDAWVNQWVCNIWSLSHKQKVSKKVADLVAKPMTPIVFLWILGLAFSVNIIEFACSIWIPQTFTKILDINIVWFIEKQYYMALYILFYMIDDLIVFGIAIYSFSQMWATTTKYAWYSHFVWWILMLILWAMLIFNPGMLQF